VTNFHVVQGAQKIEIRLPSGDLYEVTGVRGVDQQRDLAVLQVPGFDLPTVKLGNSNKVKTGERIVVIGTALGVLENSVTTGVISGIRKAEGYRLFQMDAAVSPGNSGGPVVNVQGEVVAVSVAKLSEGEGLNFAVPINYARGLLQSQLKGGLTKLAVSGETQSLFGKAPAEELPMRWKSLDTGTTKIVKQSGDYLYAENVLPPELKNAGGKVIASFEKQGTRWVGKSRSSLPCMLHQGTAFQRVKWCSHEFDMELTVVSPTRIEGVGMVPRRDTKFKCSRCEYAGDLERREFVWIPE
jgi:hypothetical protein